MSFIARLWWLSVRRRWREEGFQLLLLAGISTAHGWHTLLHPPGDSLLYVTGLLAAALLVALFLPVVFRSESVLESPRFALLPFTPSFFFLIRLLFGDPLRTFLAASTLIWGAVGLALVSSGGISLAFEVIQLILWVFVGLVAIQIAEDVFRRHLPTLFALVSLFLAYAGLGLLISYPRHYPDVSSTFSTPDRPFLLLGTDSSPAGEALAAAILLLLLWMFVRLARFVSERHARPPAPPVGIRHLSGPIQAIARRLLPRAPHALAKEVALLLRLSFSKAFIGITFGGAIIAFLSGMPILLPLAFVPWLTFSHNLFGGDLPHSGVLRYSLLPDSLSAVTRRRHFAVVLVVSANILVAAATTALVLERGISLPLATAGYACGLALLGLATIPGDRVSMARPKEIGLRTILLKGGYVSSAAWLSLGAVGVAAVGIFAAGFSTAGQFLSEGTDLIQVLGACWFSFLVSGILYALNLSFGSRARS